MMKTFVYEGVDSQGNTVSGTVDADCVESASLFLRQQNLYPTKLMEGKPNRIFSSRRKGRRFTKKTEVTKNAVEQVEADDLDEDDPVSMALTHILKTVPTLLALLASIAFLAGVFIRVGEHGFEVASMIGGIALLVAIVGFGAVFYFGGRKYYFAMSIEQIPQLTAKGLVVCAVFCIMGLVVAHLGILLIEAVVKRS